MIVPVLAKSVEITWFILVNGVTFVPIVVVPVISILSDNVNIPLFLRLTIPANISPLAVIPEEVFCSLFVLILSFWLDFS